MNELPLRILSGILAAAVALACLWFGGIAFWALVALLAAAMIGEWCGLMRVAAWQTFVAIGCVGLLMVALLAGGQGHPLVLGPRQSNYAVAVTPASFAGGATLVGLLAIAGGVATFSLPVCLGLLYVGLPAISLLFLRSGGGGLSGRAIGLGVTLLVLLIVWATDVGAYFAGRAIGGPKLAPRVSPNKTWAGLVGGMLLAVVATMLFLAGILAWTGRADATALSGRVAGLYALAAAVAAILAQAGDLFESWLKRRAGVKNSGRLLPGHGGALDRLDGLVPVSVAAALLLFFAHG